MTFKNRQRGHYFVPFNDKIADITHADTNLHTLDLETALQILGIPETRKIIMVILAPSRVSGSGEFYTYPNEGSKAMPFETFYGFGSVVVADNTQRLQYKLSVANDDWDLYCLGYVVEV